MADDDIYHNKARYEKFERTYTTLIEPPTGFRKYQVKNKDNLKYFPKLFLAFKSKDISYIRRLRLLRTFTMICHATDKDLGKITERTDIDNIVAFSHTANNSRKSKRDFIIDIKYLWKVLFPEMDEKGRPDNTTHPYVVRHLSAKIDVSKEKLRGDKFSLLEFEKLIASFGNDVRMQALLTLALESLGRPQELLGRRIKDVELHDNYAKVYISEHGKEGTGFLRCVDSYFYISKWLNEHPLKKDDEAWLFLNTGRTNRYQQLKPSAVNKLIRGKCKALGIKKNITLYSLKRNGVTLLRLAGASDLDIQHTARWTSSKQLKTYDLSNQEESFKIELIKRGKIKADKKYQQFKPKTKECPFCKFENGVSESVCSNCNRPLDRQKILEVEKAKDQEIADLKEQMNIMMKQQEEILRSIAKKVQERKEKN